MPPRRHGTILAMALVALFVVSALAAALLKTVLNEHRWLRSVEQRDQAGWLAVSAMQRARQRLAMSPDYTGETWELPAAVLGSRRPEHVLIRVDIIPATTSRRRIQIDVTDPDSGPERVLLRHERTIDIPGPGGTS